MRTIDHHRISPTDVTITVTDEPGPGGACHRYEITGFDTARNPSNVDRNGFRVDQREVTILFQQGGIPDNGVNGVTVEALLAICIDRLLGFQSGPYPCDENREALAHMLTALTWLNIRTGRRVAQGIEGKMIEDIDGLTTPTADMVAPLDGPSLISVPVPQEEIDEVRRLLEAEVAAPAVTIPVPPLPELLRDLDEPAPAPEVTQVTPEEVAAAVGETYTAPPVEPWSPSEPQPIEADLIPANPPELVPVEVDEPAPAPEPSTVTEAPVSST